MRRWRLCDGFCDHLLAAMGVALAWWVVLLVLAVAAWGQVEIRSSRPGFGSVARVGSPLGNGGWALGSGVLLAKGGGCGWVATAAHVIHGSTVQVKFPGDPRVYGGAIEYENDSEDLAVVRIAAPDVEAARLADRLPPTGSVLWVAGYGGDSTLGFDAGRLVGDVEASGGFKIRQGDSGGPIFDSQGRVISVIDEVRWPTNSPSQRTFVGPRFPVLRAILQRICGPWGCGPQPQPQPWRPQPIQSRSPIPNLTPPTIEPPSTPPPSPEIAAPTPAVPQPINITDIAAAVVDQIKADDELTTSLRGPQGPPGQPGPLGKDGASGPPGSPGATPDVAPIASKLSERVGSLEMSLRDRIDSRLSAITPWTISRILGATLGLSGPLALGIGFAGWFIGRRLKQRIAPHGGGATPFEPAEAATDVEANESPGSTGGTAKYRAYAEQLADLYGATGGRDALWDQHLGREYDEEIKTLANEAQDDGLRRVASDLRERVTRSVQRIFTQGAERSTPVT